MFRLRLVVDAVLTLLMIVNVDAAFSGAEVVFHMAAPDSSINNHQLQYSVNVQGWVLGHLDQISVCVCVKLLCVHLCNYLAFSSYKQTVVRFDLDVAMICRNEERDRCMY